MLLILRSHHEMINGKPVLFSATFYYTNSTLGKGLHFSWALDVDDCNELTSWVCAILSMFNTDSRMQPCRTTKCYTFYLDSLGSQKGNGMHRQTP